MIKNAVEKVSKLARGATFSVAMAFAAAGTSLVAQDAHAQNDRYDYNRGYADALRDSQSQDNRYQDNRYYDERRSYRDDYRYDRRRERIEDCIDGAVAGSAAGAIFGIIAGDNGRAAARGAIAGGAVGCALNNRNNRGVYGHPYRPAPRYYDNSGYGRGDCVTYRDHLGRVVSQCYRYRYGR